MHPFVAATLAAVLPLANVAWAEDGGSAFTGDLGFPFHDGTRVVGAAFLHRLAAPLADVALGYQKEIDDSIAAGSERSVVTSSAALDAVYAAPVGGGPVLGVAMEGRRQLGKDSFVADSVDGALVYAETVNFRGLGVMASVPLPYGLSIGLKETYYWVEETLDATQAELFGAKTTNHVAYAEAEPSLAWARGGDEVVLSYSPEISMDGGVISIRDAPNLSLIYSHHLTPRIIVVGGAGYSWWAGTDPAGTNSYGIVFGERQKVRWGDLGALIRYNSRRYKDDPNARPDTLANRGADLTALWHPWVGYDFGLILTYVTAEGSRDGGIGIGDIGMATYTYGGQLTLSVTL